jgi:hypothetical protein
MLWFHFEQRSNMEFGMGDFTTLPSQELNQELGLVLNMLEDGSSYGSFMVKNQKKDVWKLD